MTGPEHYREAEKWAGHAVALYKTSGDGDHSEVPAGQLAAHIAQVHATLALAAASCVPSTEDGCE